MFSTSLIEPSLRVEAFRQWIRPIADVRPADDSSIEASVTSYDLGQILVASSTSSAARYIRDQPIIDRGSFSDCMVLRLSQGGEVRGIFGEHIHVDIHEGDIYLGDLSQPVDVLVNDSRHINLLFQRKVFGKDAASLHGYVLRKDWLPCRMLTQHLVQLITTLPLFSAAEALAASEATLSVLRRCFHIASEEHGSRLWMETLRTRILGYIDADIANSKLSASLLQRKFHISRTHLYRVFSDLGGVQHCIRERRLEAAFRSICEQPDKSISDIAYRLGFSNERQFQRAFRSRYSMTASDVRYR